MSIRTVIPLFPQFTALDAIGPYEVLQRIPDIDITFIGHERGVVRSDNGMLGIEIDSTFEDYPRPDLIVFPGGHGTRSLMTDKRILDWVRSAHQSSIFTTSVCTGSLVLAAAGLLRRIDRHHTLGRARCAYSTWSNTDGHAGSRALRRAAHHRSRGLERHRHGSPAR